MTFIIDYNDLDFSEGKVSEARVIEYAENRLEANEDERADWDFDTRAMNIGQAIVVIASFNEMVTVADNRSNNICVDCGYDMGENYENCGASEDGVCPECGVEDDDNAGYEQWEHDQLSRDVEI